MSAEIEVRNGRVAMAYAGEVPWHNTGKKVLPDLTPEQMLDEADLNWTVDKQPLFYPNAEGEMTRVPGRTALVRSDDGKILTVVGDGWEPNQNIDAFNFFTEFVMEGNMEMHTAGSLRDGKMVWALAKVKDSFTLFKKDRVDSYLLFSNPHEYGRSIDIRFTPIRVVCWNTISLALNGKAAVGVRLNHTKKFDGDVVKSTLGIAHQKMDSYKEAAEALSKARYTKETRSEYINRLFPTSSEDLEKLSRNARIVNAAVDSQPGAEYGEGTFWQLFNAVTYAVDHRLGKTESNRLNSAWYGPGRSKKIEAMNVALEMAQAA
jgi:phage/plasmid-like protein (TIGR03299 family)